MKGIFLVIGVVTFIFVSMTSVFAYPLGFSYDKECADRLFNKYLDDSKPEFDKYMDKASTLYNDLSPQSESDVKDYLDRLNPLAQNYIDNLQPYAENYVDQLSTCMK